MDPINLLRTTLGLIDQVRRLTVVDHRLDCTTQAGLQDDLDAASTAVMAALAELVPYE
jgi:hypothetical protein